MPHARSHADRKGKGKTGVHRLTILRAGAIGDTGARGLADMYVDPFPYVSLAGIAGDRLYNRRSNTGRAHDEAHIQSRTRGMHTGSTVHQVERNYDLKTRRHTEGKK